MKSRKQRSDSQSHQERLWVDSLKRGDRMAFNELFNKYSKKLYFFSLSYVNSKEEAENIVQEAFLRVWCKREQLNDNLSFNGFVFTITMNQIRKYFRKKGREKKYLNIYNEGKDTQDKSTDAEVVFNDYREIADSMIEKLPARRKQIFKMSRLEGMKNQDIANELKISKKTVENEIHMVLKYLRSTFGKNFTLLLIFSLSSYIML